MTKHNSEEIKILDGKATIYTNQYNVWQFRFWLQNDEKYVRKSLRTKEKIHAIVLAEKLYHKVQNEQDKGRKYYAISIFEAVKGYVTNQKQRIGKGEFCIDKSRWKTIETHMRTFLEYVAKDDKITTLNKEILREHRRLGEKSNYVSFRKNKKISDSTIKSEMITFNSFMRYCYEVAKTTDFRSFSYPQLIKRGYSIDEEEIKKATFSNSDYKKFIFGITKYTSRENTKHLSFDEVFERELACHSFLFAANSGLRSSEIRKLQWHSIKTYRNTTARGHSGIFARLKVEKKTGQVRKTRTVYCRGGEYIDSWKNICIGFGRATIGIVFSKDGREYSRVNLHKHFTNILHLSDIDINKKKLTPHSLRHFMITERVRSGFSFNQVAVMCGSSVKQVESTYKHLNDELMSSSLKADYIELEDGTRRVV